MFYHFLVSLSFAILLISAAAIVDPDTVSSVATAASLLDIHSQKESFVSLAQDHEDGGVSKPCKHVAIRKEWRDLSDTNKSDYINAIKCLHNTQAFNQSLPSKFNRYDEFVYVHLRVADQIHGVGQFLPWHRHFGYLYERALRTQCNYQGPYPYWDWTRDTNTNNPISSSPIFNTTLGFGGDGIPGTYTPPTENDGSTWPLIPEEFKGCIETGPFSNSDTLLHVGPGIRFSDHCLNRNFDEARRPQFTEESVAKILNQTNYDDFWNSLDGFPFKPDFRLHDAGHIYIGGDMSSFYSSPNDPIFFLHHAGIDRIWWKWQELDSKTRLYQIGGRMRPFPPFGETTLDYELPFDGFASSSPIRDTMDIRVAYCYTYAD